jgi:hypothetical protein
MKKLGRKEPMDVTLADSKMKWLDCTREDLDAALASIKNRHDPEAARNIIEYYHERMSNGFSYDEGFLHTLMAYVFAGIVEGNKNADQAFGLSLERGKYDREDTTDRDVTATACILLLMRKGADWLEAKGHTANLLFPEGTGDRAVDAAYSQYRHELRHCSDDSLLEILGPFAGTAVIKRFMTA